jgi:hypothetical protein
MSSHSADDAAAFVGYLVLLAGSPVNAEPAFFATTTLAPALVALLDRSADAVARTDDDAAAARRSLASAILGSTSSFTPVGHARVSGTMRGGAAGLLAEPPTRPST